MRHIAHVVLLLAFLAVPLTAGEKASDFTFEDINPASETFGEKITLSEEYPEEGVVISFVASWCDPCWKELPILQGMVFAGHIKALAIAADEYGAGPERVLHMVARKKLTLPVLWVDVEESKELEKRYTYQMLPSTYVIRSDGSVGALLEGAVPPERLQREIARALLPPAKAAE